MLAATDAWRRRQAIESIEKRKLAHISALHTKDFDPEKVNISDYFAQVEDMYDQLKDEVMMTDEDRRRIDEESDTPFMRAGRRAMTRVLELSDPEMPGVRQIQELPQDPGESW